MSDSPRVSDASATSAINSILESFGKPKLNGTAAENITRMNANPEGYKQEVAQQIAAHGGSVPVIDSETAAVNDILRSFGKPTLQGSVAENVARMNSDPAGFKKEVDERVAAHEAAKSGGGAADRFIKGGRRNLGDIVADSRKGTDRTPG